MLLLLQLFQLLEYDEMVGWEAYGDIQYQMTYGQPWLTEYG